MAKRTDFDGIGVTVGPHATEIRNRQPAPACNHSVCDWIDHHHHTGFKRWYDADIFHLPNTSSWHRYSLRDRFAPVRLENLADFHFALHDSFPVDAGVSP